LAEQQIAPVQLSNATSDCSAEACNEWVVLCKELLNVPSTKALVQCFSRLSAPIVGYWRKIPADFSSDYRGELLRIRPSHDYSLIAERLEPSGAIELRFTLRVVFDPFLRAHRFRAEGSVSALSMEQKENILVVSSTLSSAFYAPVSLASPRDPSLTEPWFDWLQSLYGFVSAPYGSHGLEILTLRLSGAGTPAYEHPECSIGHPRLEGLKVVGDPNVPAAEFSFLVDLSTTYDPRERLAADSRVVISFVLGGGLRIVVPESRRDHIRYWFRGRGQINRTPGVWAPNWVDIDFLVYQEQSRRQLGDVLFSVLWGDGDRHMTDFKRFGDLIEPAWLLPPTLDVETEMNAEDPDAAL
jgi:hypothetical protein